MTFGNLKARIHPDATDSSHRSSSGLIQLEVDLNGGPTRIVQFFWPDTLEQNFTEEDIYRRAHRREALEDWIERDGPEKFHKYIDEVWRLKGGY